MIGRLAVALGVTVALLAAAAPAGAATTDLAAHWAFDEGIGTTAGDDSGNNNRGSLQGGVTWSPGKRIGALSFDGTGRVAVPSSSSLEPSSSITVSAWVKHAPGAGEFSYILAKGATSCSAAAYGLYTGPDKGLMFYVSGDGGVTYTRSPDAGTGVWDGAWHLVAGTFDGTTVRLYVDGVEVGSGNTYSGPIGYGTLTSRDLSIGHYDGCSGLDFSGSIDEPRIYSRALSADDVQKLALYPFNGFYQPVDAEPTLNSTKAGSAIPIKFSLGGNQGLGILAVGNPTSGTITCSPNAPVDDVEQTVTAGGSTLQYDAVSNTYTYVWKTDKTWAGTCRRLSVKLDDGSVHTASFQFSK